MKQRIVSFDATILSTYQACERKFQLQFVENLFPSSKPPALEKGDLVHKMLEIYYALQLPDKRDLLQKEVFKALYDAQLLFDNLLENPELERIAEFAVNAGRFFAAKTDLPVEQCGEATYQFSEYYKQYRNDSWQPLAVEETGSKILYESEELKVVYNCKIDLIAQKASTIAPWDHKTYSRSKMTSSLSNQFIGYCWLLDLNHIVINKIGFQKTKPPGERFIREVIMYSDEQKQEWVANTVIWAYRFAKSEQLLEEYGVIDKNPGLHLLSANYTSCDKYSGCIYYPICSRKPEMRLMEIQNNYKVREPWDVAKLLEEGEV